MRDDLAELKILQDRVIRLELELSIISKDIEVLEKDLYYLQIAKKTLSENLRVLKTEKAIAMASQYKKSIEELNYVSNKIVVCSNKLRQKIKLYNKLMLQKETTLSKFEEVTKIIENRRVILLFDQSKRKRKANEE
jgi:hypothetical protein